MTAFYIILGVLLLVNFLLFGISFYSDPKPEKSNSKNSKDQKSLSEKLKYGEAS